MIDSVDDVFDHQRHTIRAHPNFILLFFVILLLLYVQ